MPTADTNGALEKNQQLFGVSRSASAKTHRIGSRLWLFLVIAALCLTATAKAQQYYFVDCTGVNSWEYPSITSALGVAGPGSIILVTGPCNENVAINSALNLNIGAWYGQTASINGNVSIFGSSAVFLYGLNVTNPSGDGFDITSSHVVTLDTCTANTNLLFGLSAGGGSDVTIQGPSSFGLRP